MQNRPHRWTFLLFLLVALINNNIFSCSAQESTPQELLLEAVRADDPTGIQRAIGVLGADINLPGGGGQTPLVHAVLSGKIQAVQKLLQLGANVDIAEKDGYTVAHAAGFQGRAEILKILAAYRNEEGKKLIDLMHQHADGYYPFHRACWGREQRHTDTVQAFLDLGIPPNLQAANGQDCLTMTKNPATRALVQAALEKTTTTSSSSEL